MKLCYKIFSFFLLCLFSGSLYCQGGYHFGIKGGISLANQTLNESDRRMLLTYHGNLFVETRDPNDRGALYAQLGMHTRGSSFGRTNFGSNGLKYEYQNLALLLGARKKIASGLSAQPYYTLGIRIEYTLGHNLQEIGLRLDEANSVPNPINNFQFDILQPNYVNKINYGISIGGGFEFYGGDFFTPAIEFNISPDLSFQYDRPEIPVSTGTLRAVQIRNLTFEVSLVLKFLREIVYTN